MTKDISPLQNRIVQLAKTQDLSEMTYREMASYVGAKHPYSVQQAIDRLIDLGLLIKNMNTGAIIAVTGDVGAKPLLSIPILGKVSCGPATELPENEPVGYVTVSPSTVDVRKPSDTFALIAAGDSMSEARIKGKSVNAGDYVVVEKRMWSNASEGDYVISRFDNMNNLKRLHIDRPNHRYVLLSESEIEYPPIIIDEQDIEYYAIEGVAIDVIKGINV